MTSRAPRPSWARLPSGPDAPPTVLAALVERFPHVPEAAWRQRLAAGRVLDEQGRPLAADARREDHRRVAYFREVAAEPEVEAPLTLLHLDDRLVAVDKPPFLPVVPAGRFVRHCLLYRLEERLGAERLFPVHRLDRASSGVVLLARDREAAAAYGGLFARGEVTREYRALARMPRPPAARRWEVASRLVPGEPFFRMAEEAGEPNARTTVELLAWAGGEALLRLRPATGKKHQLRLHLAGLGWPIVDDRLYPALAPEGPDDPSRPLRLVATRLAFRDPFTGARRVVRSRLRLPPPGRRA